jgi:hypothetical protein
MRDLVRCRVSGRLDVDARIDSSAIPLEAKELIKRVASGTRLWALERVEVADELIAHFADALDAGAEPRQLIQRFGDERRAIALIRRAKRRNRPILWRAWRAMCWVLAALVVVYIALGLYFVVGKPSPKVDYVGLLNQSLQAVPPEDRAWPIYRSAALMLPEREPADRDARSELLGSPPTDEKRWPELMSWLNRHRGAINLIRDASTKPALGFVYGNHGSAHDPELFPRQTRSIDVSDASGHPFADALISMRMPHVQEFWDLARVLAADARAARVERDAGRFARDIDALLGMAGHVRQGELLIEDIAAIRICSLALDEIEPALALPATDRATFLSDADLTALAHKLAEPDSAGELLSYKFERLGFYDCIQRMYTDDGSGDGRLTRLGIVMLSMASTPSLSEPDGTVASLLREVLIGHVALLGTRRQVVNEYDRIMDAVTAELCKPAREASTDLERRVIEWRRSPLTRFRYAPIILMLPALNRVQWRAEGYLGRRDGVLAGIALEIHRRRHGRYPDTLDQLTPALLPRVPVDRVSGDPVRYSRDAGGRPLVYSVGMDKDDDGGRPMRTRGGAVNLPPRPPQDPKRELPDGDWVLYPHPELRKRDE